MKIFDQKGSLILDIDVDDTSFRHRAIMDEDALTLYFSRPEFIEIPVGAYVDYEGERYTLMQPESLKMQHTRDFEFTLTMESPQAKAKIWKFRNPVDGRLKFPLTAKPSEHLQMFVDNMNLRDSAHDWTVGDCIEGTETLINYDHAFCWNALSQMADSFKTEFEIVGKRVSLRKVEYGKDNPLPLSYGRGNGFKPGIGRYNSGDSVPAGILYVQGGTRNIDASKYPDAKNGKTSSTLLLPRNGEIQFDGTHFEDEKGFYKSAAYTYKADAQGYSVTRVKPARVSDAEDSLDCSSVYPSRIGTVSSVIVRNAKKHEYDIIDSSIEAGLDFSKLVIAGETMTVIFQSGELSGREFDVKFFKNTLESENLPGNRFELTPATFDGTELPGGTAVPAAGDKYAVFHCNLPKEYINAYDPPASTDKTGAEWQMMRMAVRHLHDTEKENFAFSGTLDGLWAKKDWENIGGRIKLGSYIRFTDSRFQRDGIDVRISGIKDYVNNPHSPEIELSNKTQKASFSSALQQLKSQEVSVEYSRDQSIAFTKRRFRDAEDTAGMLVKAGLKDFSGRISPIAVKAMQLVAGDESLQFRFVDSATNPKEATENFTFDSGTKTFSAKTAVSGRDFGILQHMTLGITSLSPGHGASETKFWEIPDKDFPLADTTGQSYYLYAVCPDTDAGTLGKGEFTLSKEPKPLKGADGYNLLVGILDSEYDGTRSFAPMYGYTEILPGRITTDRVVSADGESYYDMRSGAMKLGDNLEYNVDGTHKLLLKGTFVQSGSGDESPVGCYRGTYVDGSEYFPGDEVTYTSGGMTSTYRYTAPDPAKGVPPTDTSHWETVAEGSRGEKGDKGDRGPKGDKGDTGARGPQGLQGVQGDKGEQGIPGKTGASGPQGEQGPQGERGPRGLQGLQGPRGEQGVPGAPGKDGIGIKGSSVEYAASNDGTTAPKSGWSANPPSVAPGQYLWTRNTVTYSDGESTVAYSVARAGTDGATGASGADYTPNLLRGTRGGLGDMGSDNGSHVSLSDKTVDGVTEQTTEVTEDGRVNSYVWIQSRMIRGTQMNRTFVKGKTYTLSADVKSNCGGYMGLDVRVGDSSLPNLYPLSRSGRFASTDGEWRRIHVTATVTDDIPDSYAMCLFYCSVKPNHDDDNGVKGQYVTFRNVCLREGAGTEWVPASSEMIGTPGKDGAKGAKGDKGDKGDTGAKGDKGDTGAKGDRGPGGKDGKDGTSVTIKSTSVTYAKSGTSEQPAYRNFTAVSIVALNAAIGDYIWTKTEVLYSDGTRTVSYSVGRIGSDGAKGAPGAKGKDGTPAYVHFAYCKTSDDSDKSFSTVWFEGARYLGVCTDGNSADPTAFSAYKWSLIQGEDGTSYSPNLMRDSLKLDYLGTDYPNQLNATVSMNADGVSELRVEAVADSQRSDSYFWFSDHNDTGRPVTEVFAKGKQFTLSAEVKSNHEVGMGIDCRRTDNSGISTILYGKFPSTGEKWQRLHVTATADKDLDADMVKSLLSLALRSPVKNGDYAVFRRICVAEGKCAEWVPAASEMTGKTTYFHIKYSNDGGKTFTDSGGEAPGTYIGTYVDFKADDSGDVSDYKWARFQGIQGPQGERGIPGKGTDGKTYYLHIKYSDDGGKTLTASNGEKGGAWIGVYTDTEPEDSTDVKRYTWSRTKGDPGDKGETGAKGDKGDKGDSGASYRPNMLLDSAKVSRPWTSANFNYVQCRWDGQPKFRKGEKYAVSIDALKVIRGSADSCSLVLYDTSIASNTVELSYGTKHGVLTVSHDSDTAKLLVYMGTSGNTSGIQVELTNLMMVPGTEPMPWTPAASEMVGKTTYFHIKYSPVANPTVAQMTETPSDYIGTYVDYTATDSADPSKYTWHRFTGMKGTDGIAGKNGADGKTYYLHIRYSNDGGKTFAANGGRSGGAYIGVVTDTTESDAGYRPSDYTWSKIKGADGRNGTNGADGKTPDYTELRFAVNGSTVTPPALSDNSLTPSGWSLTTPDVRDYEYLWMTSAVKSGDGKTLRTKWSKPVRVKGNAGKDGAPYSPNMLKGADATLVKAAYQIGLYEYDTPPTVGKTYTLTVCYKCAGNIDSISTYAAKGFGWIARFKSKTETVESVTFKMPRYDADKITALDFYQQDADGSQSKVLTGGSYVKWAVMTPGDNGGVKSWVPSASEMTGKKGDQGYSPALVFRGEYSPTSVYYGTPHRLDAVKYKGTYYVTRVDAGQMKGHYPTDTTRWNPFGGTFDSIATGLLLADNADIAGWIFRNGRLESQAKTSDGQPMAWMDGKSGELRLHGTIQQSTSYSGNIPDANLIWLPASKSIKKLTLSTGAENVGKVMFIHNSGSLSSGDARYEFGKGDILPTPGATVIFLDDLYCDPEETVCIGCFQTSSTSYSWAVISRYGNPEKRYTTPYGRYVLQLASGVITHDTVSGAPKEALIWAGPGKGLMELEKRSQDDINKGRYVFDMPATLNELECLVLFQGAYCTYHFEGNKLIIYAAEIWVDASPVEDDSTKVTGGVGGDFSFIILMRGS